MNAIYKLRNGVFINLFKVIAIEPPKGLKYEGKIVFITDKEDSYSYKYDPFLFEEDIKSVVSENRGLSMGEVQDIVFMNEFKQIVKDWETFSFRYQG